MWRLWVLTILAIGLAGCTKNEVHLTFELPKDINEPCRILYYASGKNVGMIRETVAEITAGKGETVLPAQYPTLIYLFSPSQKEPAALIYAAKGDNISITGKNGNVAEWEISGNKTTEALTAWRLDHSELIRARRADPDKLNKAVSAYVKEHPDSEAAAIILYFYYTRKGHEKDFYTLQASLGKSLPRNERLMGALSQSDLITNMPDHPAVPSRIILTSDSGYADTLRPGKGKGMLLIFRNSAHDGIPNDTVKTILKRRQPKGTRVAELFMDPDTFAWRRYLRRDTLENMSRLWMPMGLADSVAISMGVRRIPYYIVTGDKGKELYRGDDWQGAVKKFESISP